METKNYLRNFENENYSEIKNIDVSLNDLKKWGISDKILASELFLYRIYGDEILMSQTSDDIDESKSKKITHLGENEKIENQNLLNIYDDIENSSFDEDLEIFLSK